MLSDLRPGVIVEYQNLDSDFKMAMVTENVAGRYYDAITFSGRRVLLGHGERVPARLEGTVQRVLAENLDEYLSLNRL